MNRDNLIRFLCLATLPSLLLTLNFRLSISLVAAPAASTTSKGTSCVATRQLTSAMAPTNTSAATRTIPATGSVTSTRLADGGHTLGKSTTALAGLVFATFTNPTPAVFDSFGVAVAAVGTNMVLIGANYDDTGASDTGAAYLFSTSGELLTTFTNPTPADSDIFGYAVAAVGTDKVLIGAYADDTSAEEAGAAYLFSTNGTLLTTFTNPTPMTFEVFGLSVAAIDTDKVLIGSYFSPVDASSAGAAYLFSTNGALLTTFTNPAPAVEERFGNAVAAVGTDKVLIGAYLDVTGETFRGAAYLYSTNATLLTTFTNPTPAFDDHFGYAVAAVGTDAVLIGAYGDDVGPISAGAAYLFSTNGALMTTFTNPTPANGDLFGYAVAAVRTDEVIIGAPGDRTGAMGAGAAYLFTTNGTLLTTITDPTGMGSAFFGNAVAGAGTEQVLIGAYRDDTATLNAGRAYLFSVTRAYGPLLSIEQTNGAVRVFWPLPATGFMLDQSTSLTSPPHAIAWSQVAFPYQTNATHISITVTAPSENTFYRLRKP